jgi:murein DD-endopeptidase MepM/ murein hydrolase activator NlpD
VLLPFVVVRHRCARGHDTPEFAHEVDVVRRTLRLVVLAVALTLLPVSASAQTGQLREELDRAADERERTQEQLRDARSREGTAQEQLAQIEAELEGAKGSLATLEHDLDQVRAEVESAQQRAKQARDRLAEVEAVTVELEAEYAEKRGRLDGRIRAAFKFGQVSFADTLTTANDMADFLNSNTYVAHVVAGDRELIASVEDLLVEVENQRVEARALRLDAERETEAAATAAAAVERALEEQEELTSLVAERRQEHAAALEALRQDRASLEGHLAGLEAESARIQSQLAAIARQQEEERRRREAERLEREASDACEFARESEDDEAIREACGEQEGPVGGGGWTRPVGGAVTSPFGPRPSLGGYHWGVDLRGDVGTPIRAARGGTVVTAIGSCHPTNSWTCGGGFGNYVVVAHADGFASVYAHQSTIAVGTGQQVSEGQVIGAVGNSGRSYGPHLHFEVYDGGERRNPCSYIGC